MIESCEQERGIVLSKHDKKEDQTTQQPEEKDVKSIPEETVSDDHHKKLEEELAAQKDLFLRTVAEYDNFRKRTERERVMVYTDAMADTVTKFLPVCDNLERALSHQNTSMEDLRKGVEMVLHQTQDTIEKIGVESFGEKGEAFDPARHNAVAHIDDDTLGENVIAEVMQKGYRIGDRVVRYAIVQVAN